MLNDRLHLNKNLFDSDVEKAPTRAGYGDGLVVLGETNPNVVALSADVAGSTQAGAFSEKFPDRFFNVGVAEQNMAAVAAGLGVSGKIAYISSYAAFSPGRNWEQIRTTAVYNWSDVKVAGHHTGVATGPDGPTHQATEDIASVRAWPGIRIVVPCDSLEGKRATIDSAQHDGPFYLRFTREKTPQITTENTPFTLGKIEEYWTTENAQVVIFATGYMVFYALLAAKSLSEKNVDVIVANVSTIKPIDKEKVVELVKKTGAAVTVEDHQITGGLGGTISEVLAQQHPAPIEFVGLSDTFAESGPFDTLLKKYSMDEAAIETAVKKVVKRK